jgi:hypothetical protein
VRPFSCSFSREFDADNEEKTQVKQLHSTTQVRSPRLSFLLLVLTTSRISYYIQVCSSPFFPPSAQILTFLFLVVFSQAVERSSALK